MKDNRHNWVFVKHPAKPVLTPEDVRYWKTSLSRLLKVGIEFEFNLPEQKGTCRGTDVHCPCINIGKGCWKKCANAAKCKQTPCIDTCKAKSADCKPTDCQTCKKFSFNCLGTNCVEFVSVCFVCEDFARSCEGCSKKYSPKKDPNNIRKTFTDVLNPSNSYGKVGQSGVVSITTDGSLAGDKGAEIITVGRRVDYWEFYKMVKNILDLADSGGAYVNERCSSHMHMLTSYYDESQNGGQFINELERDMPEIIMANLHQLCRKYQNAITWMTMALDKPQTLTRWEKFRVSVLDISPMIRSMAEVNKMVMEKSTKVSGNGRDKYGWINYKNSMFGPEGIKKLHVEMRVADSAMCPSYYAALACLFYALVIKAVEMSRYGILNIGDSAWLDNATKIKEAMMNNGGAGYDSKRISNTENLLAYREELVAQSFDLLEQMKGILIKLGPAYDVLIKLAKQPIALRRVEGFKWDAIETEIAVPMRDSDQIELRMNEIIDLRYIKECNSVTDWISAVSKIINEGPGADDIELSEKDVTNFVEHKVRGGELIWSESIGAMITI